MIKMVAFDLDGTIGDTIPMCIQAFRKAVSPYAGHLLTDDEILQTFGLNEIGMIKAVLGDEWEAPLQDFYVIYEQMHSECTEPFPEFCNLVAYLKERNIKIALITGKGKRSCDITLDKFGIVKYFDEIIVGSEYRPNKEDAISELLKKYLLKSNEFYYVGDTVSDVSSSFKAGVKCLSAAWSKSANVENLKKINTPFVFTSIFDLKDFLTTELEC